MAYLSYADRSSPQSPVGSQNTAIDPISTKGLNLVVRRGEDLIRHQPYAVGKNPGGKHNANKINAEGTYRPQACTRCLGSISNWNADQQTGVGASDFNELFSCIIDRRLGRDGTQCGRCVALGCGRDCCNAPSSLHAEVRKLIPALREYNTVLTLPENEGKLGRELSTEDKDLVDVAVGLSTSFRQRLSGAVSSQTFVTPQNRRKRRVIDEISELDDGITNVESQTKDLRRDVEILTTRVQTMTGEMRSLRGEVRDLERYARHGRERERHMVQVLDEIMARVVEISEYTEGEEVPVPAFDWEHRGFETEDEEAGLDEE